MNSKTITYGSWTILLLALLSWCGYAFAVWELSNERTALSTLQDEADQALARSYASVRLHALVADTVSERAALEALANTDVLAAVDDLERAGREAGVRIQIGEAISNESAAGAVTPLLREVVIVVDAEGTFRSIIHTVALFETLPFPSRLDQFSLEQVPQSAGTGAGDSWHLTARITLFSALSLSL